MMKVIATILQADDALAVMSRDIRVRLVDISASGCLLESDARLQEGLTGTLRLTFDGAEYRDEIRIVRCAAGRTVPAYRLGAEFLWTSVPGERSLRRVLPRIRTDALRHDAGPSRASM